MSMGKLFHTPIVRTFSRAIRRKTIYNCHWIYWIRCEVRDIQSLIILRYVSFIFGFRWTTKFESVCRRHASRHGFLIVLEITFNTEKNLNMCYAHATNWLWIILIYIRIWVYKNININHNNNNHIRNDNDIEMEHRLNREHEHEHSNNINDEIETTPKK